MRRQTSCWCVWEQGKRGKADDADFLIRRKGDNALFLLMKEEGRELLFTSRLLCL